MTFRTQIHTMYRTYYIAGVQIIAHLSQKHMLTTERCANELEAVSGMLTPAQDETTEGVQHSLCVSY